MTERRLWTPAPLAIAHPSLFTREDIATYEREILSNPRATEHDASRFFRRHPKFLYLGSAAEVRPEVTFRDSHRGHAQRVDFFRRRFGEKFWDIIELKDPNKPLVIGTSAMHARLSAEVDKAINQAQDYRDLLNADGDARRVLASKGIRVWKPQIIVVVGKRDDDSQEEELLRTLLDRIRQRGGIEALSYTDIFDFAKEHYSKNGLVCVPATHFAAIDIELPDRQIDDLIARLAANPDDLYRVQPRVFEEIVARLLQAQGMDVELNSPTADGGVDIHGVSYTAGTAITIAVQCKRYSSMSKIGISHIRSLLGAVLMNQMTKGILVTTSTFTSAALDLLKERGYLVSGIDRDRLLEMIREFLAEQRVKSEGTSGSL